MTRFKYIALYLMIAMSLVTSEANATETLVQTTDTTVLQATATPSSNDSATSNVMHGGVLYKDLVVGTGDVLTTGKVAVVHYSATLATGGYVDSTRTRLVPRPFKFTVGTRFTIPGMDQGVVGMKIGGRRLLEIPPEMGYGVNGKPPGIPPRTNLLFDVELVGIKEPSPPETPQPTTE